MRYADLFSGGRELAAALQSYAEREDTLVLGIVRGGVPAAVEVSAHLQLPLDLLLLRALVQTPDGRLLRAVRVAGTLLPDAELVDLPDTTPAEIRWLVDDALARLAARERQCRGDRPAVDVRGKTVILVDCGMRTGTTMRASIAAVRRAGAPFVVAAAPVGAAAAVASVEALADECVCPRSPEVLGNVSLGYERFQVPSEEQINELLAVRFSGMRDADQHF